MDIKEDQEIVDEFMDHLKGLYLPIQQGKGRADIEDIHVSGLVRCITQTFWNKYIPGTPPSDQTLLHWISGTGFEEALAGNVSHLTPDTSDHHDDIYGTPDYKSDRLSAWAEIKSTRQWWDQGKGEPKFGWSKHWIRAILAYCKIKKVTEWRLASLFLLPAILVGRKFVFTQSEIDEFWNNFFLPRKQALLAAIEETEKANGMRPPDPFKYNDSWECQRCPHQILCESMRVAKSFIPKTVHTDEMPSTETDLPYLERAI